VIPILTPEEYKRKRKWVIYHSATQFIMTFISYAIYHACRTGFAFSVTYLADDYGFSRNSLGTVDMLFMFAYGLSMMFLGFLSDRWNYKKFLAVGVFPATFSIYLMSVFAWTNTLNIYLLCVL